MHRLHCKSSLIVICAVTHFWSKFSWPHSEMRWRHIILKIFCYYFEGDLHHMTCSTVYTRQHYTCFPWISFYSLFTSNEAQGAWCVCRCLFVVDILIRFLCHFIRFRTTPYALLWCAVQRVCTHEHNTTSGICLSEKFGRACLVCRSQDDDTIEVMMEQVGGR